MEPLYYLKSKRIIGNGVVWWRPGSMGYTENLHEAGKYTKEEALSICKSSFKTEAFLCDAIDALEDDVVMKVIHVDAIDRLKASIMPGMK